jgi:hypothetical protein
VSAEPPLLEPVPEAPAPDRYKRIIEHVFLTHWTEGAQSIPFKRTELQDAATELGIKPPSNLGDIIYAFRYRADFPISVSEKAPKGTLWVIFPAGRGKYEFRQRTWVTAIPRGNMSETRIPDATHSGPPLEKWGRSRRTRFT